MRPLLFIGDKRMNTDISPFASKPNIKDDRVIRKVIRHEGTGRAIIEFDKHKNQLSDYCYWFLLGTLWVSYSGHSDLRMWKRLFSSPRRNRRNCIMKPSELSTFDQLDDEFTVYRAKRVDETDCIAYTQSINVATNLAVHRGINEIHQYTVNKAFVLALFLRRGEEEVIVLDTTKLTLIRTIDIEVKYDE